MKSLVEINTTPDDLSEKLSIGGFEVESLIDCSINVKGIVLGKVLSVVKHENSDKLSICNVDIGTSNSLQIVCGANNVKPNIYVYVAPIGVHLAAVNLTIKRSEMIKRICLDEIVGFSFFETNIKIPELISISIKVKNQEKISAIFKGEIRSSL